MEMECQCLKAKAFMSSVLSPFLGIGTSIVVKMLLACYWSHLQDNQDLRNLSLDTEDTMWKYIQWDLEACFSGVHPNTDALGNARPPGCAESILQGTPLSDG